MTGPRIAAPPGRAGRLWLERRLLAARRGADLLDRKLRILQVDLTDLTAEAEDAEREWTERAGTADRALLIAALLSGERAIALAASPGYATVSVSFTETMGVRRPADGTCDPPAGPMPWANPPVDQARRAHQAALEAAVTYAVAARALRVVEAEAAATRIRLRSIKDRLIPGLERARSQVVLAIDELERADGARVRMAGLGRGLPPDQGHL